MMPNKSIVGVTCGLLCCLMRIVMFVVSRNDLIKEIRPRDNNAVYLVTPWVFYRIEVIIMRVMASNAWFKVSWLFKWLGSWMVSGNNWFFLFIYADFQSLWWLTTKGDGSYIFFTEAIIGLLQLESPSKWKDSKLSGKKPCGRESRF